MLPCLGSTLSITGKGFGPYKSTKFNQVTFKGVPALIQRWESDLIEVRVPSQAANGPVDIIIGKKHLKAGSFTRLQPAIQSCRRLRPNRERFWRSRANISATPPGRAIRTRFLASTVWPWAT
jgi:hypothetical protein